MTIKELQTSLRHFAAERDWQRFHSPKNLTTALMVEAAELAEIFQWLSEDESRRAHENPELRARINEEAADVLLYLLQVADLAKVDLGQAAREKIVHNAIKYPAKRRIEIAPAVVKRATETHVLLDYENVQPSDDELRALVPGVSDAWVFHGPHQKNVEAKFTSFGERVVLVPINKPGKNALDFHLSYYMGYITSRNPEARFVVVANDKGYDAMLDHARELGFAVERRGQAREAPAAVSASKPIRGKPAALTPGPGTATKTATLASGQAKMPAAKKLPPTKKVAAKEVAPQAAKSAAKQGAPAKKAAKVATPARKAAVKGGAAAPLAATKIVDSLRKMANKRPAKMASLRRTVKMLLGANASDDSLTAAINNLIAKGAVTVGLGGGIKYDL